MKMMGTNDPRIIEKPEKDEYPDYGDAYLQLIPDDGRLLNHLARSFESTRDLFLSLPEEKLLHRYRPDKWSLKEILVHIVDNEWIFCYRALRFARNDKTELPGVDENYHTKYSEADKKNFDRIIEEYETVRKASLSLFKGFSAEALRRTGTASGNRVSVRALGYLMLGHEMHHVNVIKEKYL